jgi:hypothetical protein
LFLRILPLESADCLECLFEVGYDVFGILYAYRETHEVGCYACLNQLFVGELTVCVAGGVQYA